QAASNNSKNEDGDEADYENVKLDENMDHDHSEPDYINVDSDHSEQDYVNVNVTEKSVVDKSDNNICESC
ncbi:hypothetical protein M9458_054775, partial [Cirrhinus mrigala]